MRDGRHAECVPGGRVCDIEDRDAATLLHDDCLSVNEEGPTQEEVKRSIFEYIDWRMHGKFANGDFYIGNDLGSAGIDWASCPDGGWVVYSGGSAKLRPNPLGDCNKRASRVENSVTLNFPVEPDVDLLEWAICGCQRMVRVFREARGTFPGWRGRGPIE